MGGYAFYVWASYGLWAIVMILNLQFSRKREKEVRQRLKERARQ